MASKHAISLTLQPALRLHLQERVNATRFAKSQIDYALGSTGKSYVLGWGEGWARQAHHAGASCPNRPSPCNKANFDSPLANPQVGWGHGR